MSKAKIEPMSIEELRKMVGRINCDFVGHIGTESHERARFILSWIHAEARARMLEYLSRHSDCDDECCFFGEEHLEFDGRGELPHFVTAVKREVGWPED